MEVWYDTSWAEPPFMYTYCLSLHQNYVVLRYDIILIVEYILFWGEAGGVRVVVIPRRCAPLCPSSIPGPGTIHAFSFQSIFSF